MNELILKLFTMACYHGEYEPENVPNEVVEKFAELIVRECAGIAYQYDIPNVTGPGEFIGDRMIKHFGVDK